MNEIEKTPEERRQERRAEAIRNRVIMTSAALSPKMIYEIIRREGEEEMERPSLSLFWSGIAAGVMISLSVLGEAVFRTYLPDAEWSFLVENLGYSLGFMVVILGRMQLFTENTITTILPAMLRPSWAMWSFVARLWTIVLTANVIGAFAIATLYAHTSALPDNLHPALMTLSHHATGMTADESFFRAIPAGILVAAIVWMLPQAEESKFFVILVFTWLIAAGDFTHIVAGSVEMAYLAVQGELALLQAVFGFFLPVLVGNIVGGSAVFALLVWGQVRHEYDEDEDD